MHSTGPTVSFAFLMYISYRLFIMSPLCFKHAMHKGAMSRGISSFWHLFPVSPGWIRML